MRPSFPLLGWLPALLALGCAREAQRPPEAPTRHEHHDGHEARLVNVEGWSAVERGYASFYAQSLAGHRTASGERYDPQKLTAAHRTLPFGTIALVRRRDGAGVIIRINDRGPFVRGRIIDLSRRAAKELGLWGEGLLEVEVRPITRAVSNPE